MGQTERADQPMGTRSCRREERERSKKKEHGLVDRILRPGGNMKEGAFRHRLIPPPPSVRRIGNLCRG